MKFYTWRKFLVVLLWIIWLGIVGIFVVMRTPSGMPLLFITIIATPLYFLTKRFTSKKSAAFKIFIWLLFIIVIISIYNFIWWQWGFFQVKLLKEALDAKDRAFQELLAKDTYGSKTSPQETWEMYLDALRKGDIDLAVKYYVPGNDQKKHKEVLEKLKSLGSLEKWVSALGGSDTFIEIEPESWRGGIRKAYKFKFTVKEPINMGIDEITKNPLILTPEDSGYSFVKFVFIESSRLWKIYSNY